MKESRSRNGGSQGKPDGMQDESELHFASPTQLPRGAPAPRHVLAALMGTGPRDLTGEAQHCRSSMAAFCFTS